MWIIIGEYHRNMHAGVAYKMEAIVHGCSRYQVKLVLFKAVGIDEFNANVDEEQALRTWETWFDIVNLELSKTPRTLSVVTHRRFHDNSSTDISSTDISSTTVYQRTGQLYIQLLFQQI